jgi:phage gp45-like
MTMRSQVTRAKVASAVVGPRTLLQVVGLDGEVKTTVELLLPPGYSARPAAGADVTVLQVLGMRDHLVAVGGDAVGATIADLAPSEFGLTDGQQTVIFRTDHLEMNTPTYVKISAGEYVEIDTPLLKVSGDIVDKFATNSHSVGDLRAAYDAHGHSDPQGGTTGPTDHPV